MCGFRDAHRTQAFLSCFGLIRQHFALPRHLMNAGRHRAELKDRLARLASMDDVRIWRPHF
jgi:putative transposase